METIFTIIPSLSEQNTYFLFRDYAIEIKFTSINGIVKVIGNGYLLPKEVEFIKEFYT